MTDKAKKRRSEYAASHNVSRRTAANMMAVKHREVRAAHGEGPPPSPLASLLAQLHTDSTFPVQTGRAPAVGRSANPAAAAEQSRRLALNPAYYAETGGIQMTVTRAQYDLLVSNGAANDGEIQIIRTFMPDVEPYMAFGFSERCKACRRWIWCGREQREARCVCGHAYRVVFDLPAVLHWTQRNGQVCMYCGTEHTLTQPHEGRNPWRMESLWQWVCATCFSDNEVSVYEMNGALLGAATYIPPGHRNGPRNPFEGALLDAPPGVKGGNRYLIDRRGQRTEVILDRSAGGNAYMVIFPKAVTVSSPT